MLSLFKSRKPVAAPTFKTRVENFWNWYASAADRFCQTIENKHCADLAKEVSPQTDRLHPNMAWVFGPGADGVGHSLTISGEGVPIFQLLAIECVRRAPALRGWTFYASRQPGKIDDITLEVGGHKFDPKEFWLTPSIDTEAEKIDILIWHPLFAKIKDERARYQPLFLLLDEALGEFGTSQWIGAINLGNQRLADAIPLTELHSYTTALGAERGWQKFPPGESTTMYQRDEPSDDFPRSDIIVGNSMLMGLVGDHFDNAGQLEDPLADTGADFVFVTVPRSFFPRGEESDTRGRIEDRLVEALKAAHAGILVGGAFGTSYGYIDLLIFDRANSLTIIQQVLREFNVPGGSAINYFATEKQKLRIEL